MPPRFPGPVRCGAERIARAGSGLRFVQRRRRRFQAPSADSAARPRRGTRSALRQAEARSVAPAWSVSLVQLNRSGSPATLPVATHAARKLARANAPTLLAPRRARERAKPRNAGVRRWRASPLRSDHNGGSRCAARRDTESAIPRPNGEAECAAARAIRRAAAAIVSASARSYAQLPDLRAEIRKIALPKKDVRRRDPREGARASSCSWASAVTISSSRQRAPELACPARSRWPGRKTIG